jgi:hypothetical protein
MTSIRSQDARHVFDVPSAEYINEPRQDRVHPWRHGEASQDHQRQQHFSPALRSDAVRASCASLGICADMAITSETWFGKLRSDRRPASTGIDCTSTGTVTWDRGRRSRSGRRALQCSRRGLVPSRVRCRRQHPYRACQARRLAG